MGVMRVNKLEITSMCGRLHEMDGHFIAHVDFEYYAKGAEFFICRGTLYATARDRNLHVVVKFKGSCSSYIVPSPNLYYRIYAIYTSLDATQAIEDHGSLVSNKSLNRCRFLMPGHADRLRTQYPRGSNFCL